MDLFLFRRINDFIESHLKANPLILNSQKRSKGAIQFSETEERLLICAVHYPDRRVGRYFFKHLQYQNPARYGAHKFELPKFVSILEESEGRDFFHYLIFFLLDRRFRPYYNAYRRIQRSFSFYEPYLLEGLLHPEDAIGQNCAQLLCKHSTTIFSSADPLAIIASLTEDVRTSLYNIMLKPVSLPSLPWQKREALILKIGALKILEGEQKLLECLNDREEECRLALARALGHFHSENSLRGLFLLLMDESPPIRAQAQASLQALLPGLYAKKTPAEILHSLHPFDLLKLTVPNHVFLKRLWQQLGFQPDVIFRLYQSDETVLISEMVELYYMAESNPIRKSVMLLLASKMPRIMDCIQLQINYKKGAKIEILTQIMREIQAQFMVESTEGFTLLL